MYKKAVIDIDNTLWHFCGVLYEELKANNSSIPNPNEWVDWDFWINYCSENEFWGAINQIHLNQDHDEHLPYPEAKEFLLQMKKQNYHIVIASHRITDSYIQTKRWLRKHGMIFDELHCTPDKTVLFDNTCAIVIDDSPFILEKAIERGIKVSGLSFPWNKISQNNGIKLFSNLNEVLGFIL
jgi:uncharacterized HAD superfamily protein